jgi:hypothetical protein
LYRETLVDSAEGILRVANSTSTSPQGARLANISSIEESNSFDTAELADAASIEQDRIEEQRRAAVNAAYDDYMNGMDTPARERAAALRDREIAERQAQLDAEREAAAAADRVEMDTEMAGIDTSPIGDRSSTEPISIAD